MKLLELYVQKYGVLEDLTVYFGRNATAHSTEDIQPGYRLDFLVGLNGSGKSTVLHLLSRIFHNMLSAGGSFSETVELRYSIRGNEVTVSNRTIPNSESDVPVNIGGQFRFEVKLPDGTVLQEPQLREDFKPDYVIAYTTGAESAWWRELQKNSQEETLAESTGERISERFELPNHQSITSSDRSEDNPEPRFIFLPSQKLPLVSLCGLLASRKASNPESLKPVLGSMNLEKLVGFSLRIRINPSWTDATRPDLINRLEEIADHEIQVGADRLLIFNFDKVGTVAHPILNLYSSSIELFKRMNELFDSDPQSELPFQEVNLFFRSIPLRAHGTISDPNQYLYSYESLSDGERSFLGRMALFSLFSAANLLIMLDEPEVHFNDAWKREIVNMLHEIMKNNASHALITTHSSIALTDVARENIVVLEREGLTTRKRTTELGFNTLGADPSDVLVHVFGTQSAAGKRSSSYINKKIADATTRDDLEKLEAIVAPGYWRYRIELEKGRLPPATRRNS